MDERSRRILHTSLAGVGANVALAIAKAVVGLVAHSVAIVLDAINNLSDALSSVITIVGMRMASKPADREHPFGHGRIEYLTAIVIAAIVMAAGVSSLWESVRKIGNPEPVSFEAPMLAVIGLAILVKVVIAHVYRRVGTETNSDALVASGADARFDVLISIGTLASAAISMAGGPNLDAYVGVVIAVVIIKGGWDLLMGPVNALVGTHQDPHLAGEIRADIESFPGVEGAYDLTLHGYGPERAFASVNIGVADTMTAHQIGDLTHRIQKLIRVKYGLDITVGVHPMVTGDPKLMADCERVREMCSGYVGVREVHGVYIDPHDHDLSVDVIADFDITNPEALRAEISSKLQGAWPGYDVQVDIDRDYSE